MNRSNLALAYVNLGSSLHAQGKPDEAIAATREALRLQPDLLLARGNLGKLLYSQGKYGEAIVALRRAILLAPDNADYRFYLGDSLLFRGDREEALDAYRHATRLRPDHALAHGKIGHLLSIRGEYAESLAELRRALGADPGRGEEAQRILGIIREVEEKVAAAARWPALLKGDDRPKDAAEAVTFARVCHDQGRLAGCVRLYREAFAADPKLAEDLAAAYRLDAACAAALAGCGQGKDNPPLDEAARSPLREQAREWLAADMARFILDLDSGTKTQREGVLFALRVLENEPELAGVHNPEALAKLPEAERKRWQAFWADHEALLKKAGGP